MAPVAWVQSSQVKPLGVVGDLLGQRPPGRRGGEVPVRVGDLPQQLLGQVALRTQVRQRTAGPGRLLEGHDDDVIENGVLRETPAVLQWSQRS